MKYYIAICTSNKLRIFFYNDFKKVVKAYETLDKLNYRWYIGIAK